MDVAKFEELVFRLHPFIRKQDTVMRESLKPTLNVAVILRFLATGEYLEKQFRVSRQSISSAIKEVCEVIFQVLTPEYLKTPNTREEWLRIASGFQDRGNFPNCSGAIDGKHIVMAQPGSSGSHYRNYKGTDSIVLLAVVGPNYEFLLARSQLSPVGISG